MHSPWLSVFCLNFLFSFSPLLLCSCSPFLALIMPKKISRPYGLWDSPISPRSLSVDKRLSEVQWDSDGQTLVWLEGRSDRGVLVVQDAGDDAPRDLTSDLSVRAEVGYGGGDF